MEKRGLFLVAVLAALLLQSVLPAIAEGPPIPNVYVSELHEGNEEGSEISPYNTVDEGIAYAQSLDYGARLHVTYKDGSQKIIQVESVHIGSEGTILPSVTLYVLLAAFALVMLVVGWRFRRRARRLEG